MKILIILPIFLLIAAAVMSQGKATDSAYFCPPCGDCDTIQYAHPGVCPHCMMALVRRRALPGKPIVDNSVVAVDVEKPLSVCFYLQDGVEVLDFAGPMEVFVDAGFRVFTVSRSKKPFMSQGSLTIMPDYSIADAPPSDILAFFGGNTGPSTQDTTLISWIRKRKGSTRYFFSVCTGAFIMGRAGILDGMTATTFHESIENLQKMLPSTKVLANVRFVDNGQVITTAGISAGIDGALHLVTKLKGEEVAKQTAFYMEYDKWVPGQGLVLNEAGAAR